MKKKQQFIDLVKSNIKEYGYHLTLVKSKIEPRYVYSIGLNSVLNFELILAGGIYYSEGEVYRIFDGIIMSLKKNKGIVQQSITIGPLGSFSLCEINSSWSKFMLLGVFDYYDTNDVLCYQIMPDSKHFTFDTPKMSNEFNVSLEPVWKWLVQEWSYPVPSNSTVITNIEALKAEPITEIMRWEENEWEMFAGAGPDIDEGRIRVVPLGTIIGIDNGILPAIKLNVGKGLWREDANSDWNDWG